MRIRICLLVLLAAVLAAPSTSPAHDTQAPSLKARGLLPAQATAPAPFPGAPNLEPVPAPGATQPVGGFSALLDAPGKDTFWAMPDNGFGAKANSRSFLLRVYEVRANWETKRGGPGTVKILDWITLRDPNKELGFAIVRDGTTDRLLTGGDLDIESMRVDRDGNLWFGEEFGPFLVKTDRTGKVLQKAVPLPDVKSPDYPADFPAPFAGDANLGRSNGFEGTAITSDGRRLMATLEGAVVGDDPTVRRVYEFDIRSNRYTGRTWRYPIGGATLLVSDLTALDRHGRFVALERDNFQGPAALHKRGFVVRLRDNGTVDKREVVDLLNIADRHEISLPARPGDFGLGSPFSMPYVTIESVLPVGRDRVAIVNDTNFGSTGRNPNLPDDSDFIVVKVPGLGG